MRRLCFWLVSVLVLSACGASPTSTLPQNPSTGVPPTRTVTPTAAPSPTVTPTPLPTSTPAPTATPRIPVIIGTAVPLPAETISDENVQNLTQLAAWGPGEALAYTLSADGSLLAVAKTTGVYVVDAASLEEKLHIATQSAVLRVAFSPDGSLIAAGEIEGTLHVYRTEDGEALQALAAGPGEFTSVAFSPDGQVLLSGMKNHYDQFTALWEVGTGKQLATYPYPIGTVAFSPREDFFAVITPSEVQVHRLSDAGVEQQFPVNGCASVQYSPDGSLLVVTCGSTIRLLNAADGALVTTLSGSGAILSPDQQRLLNVIRHDQGDEYVVGMRQLNVETGQYDPLYQLKASSPERSVFSPDGKRLALQARGGVSIVQVEDGMLLQTFPGAYPEDFDLIGFRSDTWRASVDGFRFSPDGKALITSAMSTWPEALMFVRFWDVETGAELRTLRFAQGDMSSGITFSPDGTALATGGTLDYQGVKNQVSLYQTGTGELVQSLETGWDDLFIGRLFFSPDGKQLIVRKNWNEFLTQRWQLSPTKLLGEDELFLPDGAALVDPAKTYLDVSPDGSLLAVEGDRAVEIVQTSDLQRVARIAHQGMWGESDWAFSPDGQTIAIAIIQKYVGIWDARTGVLLQQFATGSQPKLAFSPDGTILAVLDHDAWIPGNAIDFYRVSDGTLLYTIKTPTIYLAGITFSPDGTLFAAKFRDSIHVWGIKLE